MKKQKNNRLRVPLVFYDLIIFMFADLVLFVLYQGGGNLSTRGMLK